MASLEEVSDDLLEVILSELFNTTYYSGLTVGTVLCALLNNNFRFDVTVGTLASVCAVTGMVAKKFG